MTADLKKLISSWMIQNQCYRKPPSSRAAIPLIVVPPGLATRSFNTPGWSPISSWYKFSLTLKRINIFVILASTLPIQSLSQKYVENIKNVHWITWMASWSAVFLGNPACTSQTISSQHFKVWQTYTHCCVVWSWFFYRRIWLS